MIPFGLKVHQQRYRLYIYPTCYSEIIYHYSVFYKFLILFTFTAIEMAWLYRNIRNCLSCRYTDMTNHVLLWIELIYLSIFSPFSFVDLDMLDVTSSYKTLIERLWLYIFVFFGLLILRCLISFGISNIFLLRVSLKRHELSIHVSGAEIWYHYYYFLFWFTSNWVKTNNLEKYTAFETIQFSNIIFTILTL